MRAFGCILDLLNKKFSFTSCYFSSACRLHADDVYESQWKMTHKPRLCVKTADNFNNHKNYNFLNCDWFKKLLFPTQFTCQVVIGQFVIGQFNKPIKFTVVV